jgi:hypothetical protein
MPPLSDALDHFNLALADCFRVERGPMSLSSVLPQPAA